MFAFLPMGILHEIFHSLTFQKYGVESNWKVNKTIIPWKIFRTDTDFEEFIELDLKKQRNILFSGPISELIFIPFSVLILYYNLLPTALAIIILVSYLFALSINLVNVEIFGVSSDRRIYLQLKEGNYEKVRELLSRNDI